jgi:hypothetical protein
MCQYPACNTWNILKLQIQPSLSSVNSNPNGCNCAHMH